VEANTQKWWYRIAELDGVALKGTVAGSRLKKFVTRAPESEVSNEQEGEDQDISTSTLHQETVSGFAVIVPMREPGEPLDFVSLLTGSLRTGKAAESDSSTRQGRAGQW